MPNDYIAGNNRITVDILDRNQAKVGPGPIMTCLGMDCDSLLSQAGHFTARFPANDSRLAYLELKKHYLDFYYDGQLIFYGLAEQSREEIDNSGERILVISGRDSLAVLSETSVNYFHVSTDTPVFNAPVQILSFDSSFGYAGDDTTATGVYGDFVGENVLSALTRIAENIGECFRLYGRDSVWWMNDFETSTLRAIGGVGDTVAVERNPNVCLIQRLAERRDTSRLITRIHPYGSGFGETRLDLSGNDSYLTMPTGFTYDAALNYIESDAAAAYIGKTISRTVSFKDIRPLFNTDADMVSAKNFLFDAALAYLQRNDSPDDVVEYDLDVVKLPASADPGSGLFGLRPGMTIRVVYQDDRYNLDTDLIVLGIRTAIGDDGAATYSLTVSNINQWRLKETSNSIADLEEGQILSGHAQIDANSYWKHYKEWIGDDQIDHMAEIPFFLSREVVTIRQVLFRCKVERILAATKSYAQADDTLPNVASPTGPALPDVTGPSLVDTSGPSLVTATLTSNTTASATANAGNTGPSAAATTDNAVYTGGVAQTDLANAGVTATPSANDTAQNVAGTNIASGIASTMTIANVRDNLLGGTLTGNNTVVGDPHQHDLNHFHDVPAGSHTHTFMMLPQHTHPPGLHTHTITATHRHPIPAHTHGSTLTHVHTLASTHTHNIPHTHDMPHTHNIAHTHNMPHTHASPIHIHPLPPLVQTFALLRTPALQSYVIADLEYSVNGGAWFSLDGGIPVAGGYYELDVTPTIQNPAGLRRPYQEDNIVQIRRKTTAGTGKTAQIRVELGIRCTIQSIAAYS